MKAMGEEVRTNGGQRAKLIRPLDFLVLSVHAEYLGIADLLNKGDPAGGSRSRGPGWRPRRPSRGLLSRRPRGRAPTEPKRPSTPSGEFYVCHPELNALRASIEREFSGRVLF